MKTYQWAGALFLIIFLSAFLRFFNLESIPVSFHHDEVSQAYNAYSLGVTGHDRYGEYFPLLFRSFGSFQPPLYTYLSILPVMIFGNTIFAARFASAFFGVMIVLFTYLIVVELAEHKLRRHFGLLAALIVGISPWAIHFSRKVVEANLGLAFFLIGFYFLLRSIKSAKFFLLAMLFIGISTHAYYSERVIALLIIPLFLFLFRKHFLQNLKTVISGIEIFALTQLPHLILFTSGAYSNRFNQVSYLSNNAGFLANSQEFIRHIIIYLSPKHLFADTGTELARIAPNLGAFYPIFLIPFLIGLIALIRRVDNSYIKLLLISIPVFLVPASLTGDIFYPLRVLEYLWGVSIIISFGILLILEKIKLVNVKLSLLGVLVLSSVWLFYESYAVLFKYETSGPTIQVYNDLNRDLKAYSGKRVLVDNVRDPAIGLRIAYFRKYDPRLIASNLAPQVKDGYYTSKSDGTETYKFDNIEFRPFAYWKEYVKPNTILIGDPYTVLIEETPKDSQIFTIKNQNGNTAFYGYRTK